MGSFLKVWRGRAFGLALVFILGLTCASGVAFGSGLQVVPTGVTIEADQQAAALWLSNTGAEPIHAQVRLLEWGARPDSLANPTGVVASPSMLTLAPGTNQMVRILRIQAPPAAEQAVRLWVDELPTQASKGLNTKGGIKYLLRYSIPLFLDPAGGLRGASLHWRAGSSGGRSFLEVTNSGDQHAQLADLSMPGIKLPGLIGYVLAGQSLQIPLSGAGTGGHGKVMVNGIPGTFDVTLN